MYTVVRCSNCERCWGIMGKTRKCPHCGTAAGDDIQIVSIAENASELQREVALANMPESLREEMRDKLPKAIEINENPSATLLFECIRIAAIDDIVELDRLAGALRGKGITIAAEDVAEEAISQGLLIRRNDDTYLLLQ
ncbi:MAG: hydrogenase maturation nickel metallochaperone HypA [Candidatus Poseidoniaceae archaeon]|nr:hydrogenase maturation nickel metallochaperone HypA [Candidatus Poseidoniaceae archaeon]